LATTYDVTSKLTGCTITTNPLGRLVIADDYKCLGNFYGGGSLGKVNGPVKSTLTNCTVEGSVFGAGYSASRPNVEVDAIGFETEPYYYEEAGTYRVGVKYKEKEAYKPITYTWQHRDEPITSTGLAIDKTNHILYTNEDLTTLGTVEGKVTLNIEGNTLVEGYVLDESGNPTIHSGGVFGGGDSSAALGNTEVNINTTSLKEGAA
jgi:hypothetical protein